jgi:hypothetical protein
MNAAMLVEMMDFLAQGQAETVHVLQALVEETGAGFLHSDA